MKAAATARISRRPKSVRVMMILPVDSFVDIGGASLYRITAESNRPTPRPTTAPAMTVGHREPPGRSGSC